MVNKQLEWRIKEPIEDKNKYTASVRLLKYGQDEGIMLSEGDIRSFAVTNFGNSLESANSYWATSTLSAIRGNTVKVILPYETGSRTLTRAAKYALDLINNNETLDNDIWANLEGIEVYEEYKNEWFEKIKGVFIGFNVDMTEKQTKKCPLLLTKLGHQDYVNSEFVRPEDEIDEIIGETFRLKLESGYRKMMGQYLPKNSDKGILRPWLVGNISNGARSNLRANF